MKYYSHGKLLLTAEYSVLDGATALALPTRLGQYMTVETTSSNQIQWKSIDSNQTTWIDCSLDFSFNLIENRGTPLRLIDSLIDILKAVDSLAPGFYGNGVTVCTELEFDRHWGLGSSSTLIANLADWLAINPYHLLKDTFGGSGYDLAAAKASKPILYQRNKTTPKVEEIDFLPPFADQLFFLYLNQKQNSRSAISSFRQKQTLAQTDLNQIRQLTKKIVVATTQEQFNALLVEHEEITAQFIGQTPVKKRLFDDFSGQLKSLGAWGGDFVLVSGNSDSPAYFKSKGFATIIPYNKMILSA